MSLLDREFQQLADRTSKLVSQRELNRDQALEVNDRRAVLPLYVHAEMLRQLNGEHTHASGRAIYKDSVSRLEIGSL